MRDIFEIKFEIDSKDRKGMDTEDSVLRATEKVCKSLSIGLLRRIMPPRDAGIGECDAVVFSDSGVFVIEAKRYGGEIESIEGTSKGVMKLLYSDKTKRTTKEINKMIFRVNIDNRWEEVSLKTTRGFKWTCIG